MWWQPTNTCIFSTYDFLRSSFVLTKICQICIIVIVHPKKYPHSYTHFVVVWYWLIYPYYSGLHHWHHDNTTIAPVPVKQVRTIWLKNSNKSTSKLFFHSKTKHNQSMTIFHGIYRIDGSPQDCGNYIPTALGPFLLIWIHFNPSMEK